jgi:peptidyl-dipeptidase Dcp
MPFFWTLMLSYNKFMKITRLPELLGITVVSMSYLFGANGSGQNTAASEINPLIAEWTGRYGGVPAFDKMDLRYLKPALEEGMKRMWAEIEAIAKNPEPATFENTIEALEDAGRDLARVRSVYNGIWGSNLSTPEYREIQKETAPLLSGFDTRIIQNEALFARIQTVYHGAEKSRLRPDQQRLLQTVYDRYVREGATLEGGAKERYAAINQRLTTLQNQFSNNVLADEEGYVTFLNSHQLAGLPDSFLTAAAAMASKLGKTGTWAVTNTRSSMDPFLTFSDERDLREKVWRNYYNRGDNGDDHDNNAIITEILQLRYERSKLLGYNNYAEWKLEPMMAKSPDQVMNLLNRIWPMATKAVEKEVARMQSVADAEGLGITIEPWDYRYYANKVQQADYALDSSEVEPYLQLDKLREAMFYVAVRLFDFAFTPVPENTVPVFQEDVKVWEVSRKSTGDPVGLWYFDPFARPGKKSGAWATTYRLHETFLGKRTVLSSNNSNFVKPPPGSPLLISWDDANTLFHEFGHALNFLSSNAAYPGLNFALRDFIEFPSQLLEHWLSTDEVLGNFLLHYETGQPMPAELVAKIKRAANFNQGFATTEYMASAIMDMKYHTTDPKGMDSDAFEKESLESLGMPSEIVMRHRSPHFQHIFSSEGYAAGYYSYLWAEVLTADAAEAFKESPNGFYDEELGRKMVEHLFAPGDSVDPADAYRAFRGRDPHFEALVRARRFPEPVKP